MLPLEASDQDLCEFATIHQVIVIVFFRTKEAGGKDDAQVISVHLIEIFLFYYVLSKEHNQQNEDFFIHILHPVEHLLGQD